MNERSAVEVRRSAISHSKPLHQPSTSTRMRGEGSASTPLHQPSCSTSVPSHAEAQVRPSGFDDGEDVDEDHWGGVTLGPKANPRGRSDAWGTYVVEVIGGWMNLTPNPMTLGRDIATKCESCFQSWCSSEDFDRAGYLGVCKGYVAAAACLAIILLLAVSGAVIAQIRKWRRRSPRVQRRRRSTMPCRRIGGQRHRCARSGRTRGDPTMRIRARCRRIEAMALAYLAISHHVTAVVMPAGPIDIRAAGHPWADGAAGGDDRDDSDSGGGMDCVRICANASAGRQIDQPPRQMQGDGPDGNRWWTGAARVGEASHPGPTAVTVAAAGLLRKIVGVAGEVMSYPLPGTGSLRGAIAPGFGSQGPSEEDADQLSLRIEYVNTTGWRALQRRLIASESHYVHTGQYPAGPGDVALTRRHPRRVCLGAEARVEVRLDIREGWSQRRRVGRSRHLHPC